jgi:hypothetical protein
MSVLKQYLFSILNESSTERYQYGKARAQMQLDSKVLSEIHQQKIGELNGMSAWTINGEYVRNNLDIDFTTGGNPARYRYVPANELWVEVALSPSDFTPSLLHEFVEYCMMKYKKKNYDDAHDTANKFEKEFRRKEVSRKIEVIGAEEAVETIKKFLSTHKSFGKLLKEVSAEPHAVKAQGLAVGFIPVDDGKIAVLYSPKEVLADIEKAGDGAVENLADIFEPHIKGMIRFQQAVTGECWGAWEINRVAAVPGQGYGKMLYAIAMAATPKHRIMPDRQSVSPQAAGVWQKMAGAKKLKLDDEEDPQTEPTEDDCKLLKDPQREFLDYAYEGSGISNLHGLNDGHEEFLSDLGFTLTDEGNLEKTIEQAFEKAAINFFQSRMME